MCVCLHCTKDAPGYYFCVCVCTSIHRLELSISFVVFVPSPPPSKKRAQQKVPTACSKQLGQGLLLIHGMALVYSLGDLD
jgi:hypothetical protein